jgi:hypothetical protein
VNRAPNIEAKRRALEVATRLLVLALRWIAETLPELPLDEQRAAVARTRGLVAGAVLNPKEER